jgi:hydroxymethylpyrimidine pyrophosphatase-like HAD family hydrolase
MLGRSIASQLRLGGPTSSYPITNACCAHVPASCTHPLVPLAQLPPCAGKGGAMAYVAQQLGYEPAAVVACGDSSNDIHMWERVSERG